MEIVLITGMSGSGKSVALHALEDAGFTAWTTCRPSCCSPGGAGAGHHAHKLAIAMDVRSATSLPLVPLQLKACAQPASRCADLPGRHHRHLVRRFSETRRRHPLSQGATQERALVQAIELERELLADLRERSTVIDTSHPRPPSCSATTSRTWCRRRQPADPGVPVLRLQARHPGGRRLRVRRAHAAQPHYEPELRA
jgi:UPF0042 nucleotide-binding protein